MNEQAEATRTVKEVLSAWADGITTVRTAWRGRPNCERQTFVLLNAAGQEEAEAIHAFAVGAFSECKVTLSPAGFLDIAWPGKPGNT